MSWIKEVAQEEATGKVKKTYDDAIARAGRIWNIVKVMSLNEDSMDASLGLYKQTMFGESPLSRFQREMLATVVAAHLNCEY